MLVTLSLDPKLLPDFPKEFGPAAKMAFERFLGHVDLVRASKVKIYDLGCEGDAEARLCTVNEDAYLYLGRLGADGRRDLSKFLYLMFADRDDLELTELVLAPKEGGDSVNALYIVRMHSRNSNVYRFNLNFGRIPAAHRKVADGQGRPHKGH